MMCLLLMFVCLFLLYYLSFGFRNPLVSSVEMQERMTGRKMVSMSSIQKYIIGGDIEGDWVTIGVIVSKDIKKSSKVCEYLTA